MRDLKSMKGFTLLEVLIVLVILAVLAGLAVPAYQTAVEKSRKQEALATLGAIRSSQARYWATRNTYTATPADLDFDWTIAPAGSVTHYTYAIGSGAAGQFTATATRLSTNRPTAVVSYTVTIDQTGNVTSTY